MWNGLRITRIPQLIQLLGHGASRTTLTAAVQSTMGMTDQSG